jgi:hypothetical protein
MPNIGAKHVASIRRGVVLEVWTLSWNVVGVVILAFAAYVARSSCSGSCATSGEAGGLGRWD